jgi:acyl dehydratase
MTLDLAAVGHTTRVFEQPYDFRSTILYALGIGATSEELDFLYEARGPKVFPSFGLTAAYPVLSDMLERSKASLEHIVHSGQALRFHAPIPPAGKFETVGTLTGMYDLKRFAELTFSTRSTVSGALVCETEWSLLVMNAGGFGGPRPPKRLVARAPSGVAPKFEFSQKTSREQAALYRLSGDLNPLHIDPERAHAAGFDKGPILHGLCTLGFIARAVQRGALGGDPSRLVSLAGQFKRPVWPGETIVVRGFESPEQGLVLDVSTVESGEAVMGNCVASVSGGDQT